MKAKSAFGFLCVLIGTLLAGSAYAQTGQYLDEFGASCKSTAMGQAFTAVADDYSAAYYNPAGLTQTKKDVEYTFGYYYSKPRPKAVMESIPNRYDGDMPRVLTEQPALHGAIIGIASSLDIDGLVAAYPWFKRLAYGMVFYMNLPHIFSYETGPDSYRPHFFRWDTGFSMLSLSNSIAFEITPWFSVGAGFFLGMNNECRQEVFSALNYSSYIQQTIHIANLVPDEVIGSRLTLRAKTTASAVPIFGILIKPPKESIRDKYSLGISYRGRNKTKFAQGDLVASIGLEEWETPGQPFGWGWRDFVNQMLFSIVGFSPEQITGSLAARPIEGLLIAFDLTWKNYSQYVDFNDTEPDAPFEDVYVPRLGIEYGFNPGFSGKALKWVEYIALRGGYFFEATPVKEINTYNMFDTDTDVISCGFQVDFTSFQGRMLHSVETYAQAHLLRDRYVSNENDPIFGPAQLSGEVWSFGATITSRF